MANLGSHSKFVFPIDVLWLYTVFKHHSVISLSTYKKNRWQMTNQFLTGLLYVKDIDPLCMLMFLWPAQHYVSPLWSSMERFFSRVAKTPGLKAKQYSWDVIHHVPAHMSTGVKKSHHTDLLLTASLQFITLTSYNYSLSVSLTLYVLFTVSYSICFQKLGKLGPSCQRSVSLKPSSLM